MQMQSLIYFQQNYYSYYVMVIWFLLGKNSIIQIIQINIWIIFHKSNIHNNKDNK